MARKVYFSFHYDDVASFRANVVRNRYAFKTTSEFHDASIWEEAEESKVGVIKALIDSYLKFTSVTCVLIGSGTFLRRFVRYEIVKSFSLGKGLLGVGINWVKDNKGRIKFWPGENPFSYLKFKVSSCGKELVFFEYVNDDWRAYKDLRTASNRFPKVFEANKTYCFSQFCNRYSYDWDNGKDKLHDWIEQAAVSAGK